MHEDKDNVCVYNLSLHGTDKMISPTLAHLYLLGLS